MLKKVIFLICIFFSLISCTQDRIKTYKTPKEILPVIQLVKPNSQLNWSIPSSWIEKPLDSFRKASYDVPLLSGSSADFSIVSFPGDVGGLLSNVNRWNNQLGLPPISVTELDQIKTKITHNYLDIILFDLRSSNEAIVVATFPFNNEFYFFKLFFKDLSSVNEVKNELIRVLDELEIK